MKIDWLSNESHLLINPRWPDPLKERLRIQKLPHLPGHFWIPTSGTTQNHSLKLIALSKEALLINARSVVSHLKIEKSHRWLNVLPIFHVGGLSILARAFVLESTVISPENFNWNPGKFFEHLNYDRVQWTSLVPTQLFDLILKKVVPPSTLKGVIIGGGAMERDLYVKARQLGWPIYPSYGMTEAGSQIATADSLTVFDPPPLTILEHLKVRTNDKNHIEIQGESLLTGKAEVSDRGVIFSDPKVDGWFTTSDRGEVDGSKLKILGRADRLKKISGELVNEDELQKVLHQILLSMNLPRNTATICLNPNYRLGHQVDLVLLEQYSNEKDKILNEFNSCVAPYEKVRNIYLISKMPLTDLGKIASLELSQQLGF